MHTTGSIARHPRSTGMSCPVRHPYSPPLPPAAATTRCNSRDFGDVLAVWKLDRLGRSVKEVLTLADELHGRAGSACVS